MASLSGGLATMGCGVPYAIAAEFAYPERAAIALAGDGAMQMNGNIAGFPGDQGGQAGGHRPDPRKGVRRGPAGALGSLHRSRCAAFAAAHHFRAGQGLPYPPCSAAIRMPGVHQVLGEGDRFVSVAGNGLSLAAMSRCLIVVIGRRRAIFSHPWKTSPIGSRDRKSAIRLNDKSKQNGKAGISLS
ncbi:thiamine pyrophosphate-dependent enzyme [Methylocaldum szegediense]|nr:thiamine pyrophosphate-dependent enzyme [Methylocaldum szegediense]